MTHHNYTSPRRVAAALTFALLMSFGAASQAGPQGRDFGLGIILGEPTGITGKYFFSDEGALDFHVAWDFRHEALGLYVDYLFHFYLFSVSAPFELPLYVGPGAKVLIDDHYRNNRRYYNDDTDVSIGFRLPVGLAMLFERVPLEIFLEIVPGMRLIPSTDFDLDWGIGIRYYF